MRKSRFTDAQIVAVLKEVESGVPVADVVLRGRPSDERMARCIACCVFGRRELAGAPRVRALGKRPAHSPGQRRPAPSPITG